MKIDAHQHFWRYSAEEYPWIRKEWPLRRDFLPDDLEPLLKDNGFSHCIAVQARQTVEETRWLCELAERHAFIAGVVGWVDLRGEAVRKELESVRHPRLVGVRHVVQDEPEDNFMLGREFQRGIEALAEFDLAYDILIFPKQLPAAIELARNFPNQRFILDHLAKPLIKEGKVEPWARLMRELGRAGNVACKISGMVTEARWGGWKAEDFRTYLDVAWEAFGEDRLMVGSDWPVSLLSSEYERTMDLALDFLEEFQEPVQRKLGRENAVNWYKLRV